MSRQHRDQSRTTALRVHCRSADFWWTPRSPAHAHLLLITLLLTGTAVRGYHLVPCFSLVSKNTFFLDFAFDRGSDSCLELSPYCSNKYEFAFVSTPHLIKSFIWALKPEQLVIQLINPEGAYIHELNTETKVIHKLDLKKPNNYTNINLAVIDFALINNNVYH